MGAFHSRATRLRLGLIAPVALIVLVVSLGVLQYRWVGQISERERDQLRQSLDRRTRAFADDFDREISRAYEIFSFNDARLVGGHPQSAPTAAPLAAPAAAVPEDADSIAATSARFARGMAEWQSASRFPGLIKAAYFVDSTPDALVLYRFDRGSGQLLETTWPEQLRPLQTRLDTTRARAQASGGKEPIALSASPLFPAVPALLIPQMRARAMSDTLRVPAGVGSTAGAGGSVGGTVQMFLTIRSDAEHVALEFDSQHIASTVLPALAASHLPERDGFRLSVSGPGPTRMFVRGVADESAIAPGNADATAGFFSLRTEMMYSVGAFQTIVEQPVRAETFVVAPGAPPAPASAPSSARPVTTPVQPTSQQRMLVEQAAARTTEVRLRPSGWTLLVQHPAGSLDAMVAQTRRRNLMLSFGILSVLAMSAGLLVVSARRAEKLASQQMEFVATVSHELRTPLAVIRSAAQNLSAGVVADAAQAKQYGTLIETEGRRLTDMVEQVLEYAGLSDAKRRGGAGPVDAARLIEDVVDVTSSLPEAAAVRIDANADPQLPAIMADEDAVRRALHNLIGNALKYAAEGGWIGVRGVRGAGADSGFVLISVADRGQGIPAADLARIFEPFYRGRHAVEGQIRGNGLGLSLVKGIAEAAGGRVRVASTPGEGSTFTLYFPVVAGAADAAGADHSPSIADAATSGTRTV